jgi:hypothetical protein
MQLLFVSAEELRNHRSLKNSIDVPHSPKRAAPHDMAGTPPNQALKITGGPQGFGNDAAKHGTHIERLGGHRTDDNYGFYA